MSSPYDSEDPAVKQFKNELLAVFKRWYEESDLDDFDMECAATEVIESFCGTSLEFESDMDWDDDE